MGEVWKPRESLPCSQCVKLIFNPITPGIHKMVKYKLKILQQILQDF